MLNRLEQSGGRQQGLLCLSRARGSSWTATASVSSSGAVSCYEWFMKSRSEEISSNSLPQAELSSMGELVLILVGFCPWVHTAMQGKICFLPLHLHPAEPCVSVELCWPAESRVFYQSFTRAICSPFWPHSGIPPLSFSPRFSTLTSSMSCWHMHCNFQEQLPKREKYDKLVSWALWGSGVCLRWVGKETSLPLLWC